MHSTILQTEEEGFFGLCQPKIIFFFWFKVGFSKIDSLVMVLIIWRGKNMVIRVSHVEKKYFWGSYVILVMWPNMSILWKFQVDLSIASGGSCFRIFAKTLIFDGGQWPPITNYWRLHVKSWSVILIFRTKCSLLVSQSVELLIYSLKKSNFFWIYFYLSLLSWSQKCACILLLRVDTTQNSYIFLFIIFLSSRVTLMVI